MESTLSFGYWIRRQRKTLDLTQQVLADRVGCSLAAIKKIESDERRPSRQIAERLADILNVPADQREIFLEVACGLQPTDQLWVVREAAMSTLREISSLPSGTVTFLFTDIEGSTKLAQAHADQWDSLRARHNTILKTAIESYNGFVFQIIGDAFCAAFHTAVDALNAAVKAQCGLQAEEWGESVVKVRMGLHTGSAELHGNDYRGYLTMAKVQRVMSVAYGGQVLLSNTSAELVRYELPKEIALRDMDEHRLKGMPDPERLWQLVAPDLQQDFPALQSHKEIPNNLPVQLTSFIGREKEVEQIKQLLEMNHLVTLTGSGALERRGSPSKSLLNYWMNFPMASGWWNLPQSPIRLL